MSRLFGKKDKDKSQQKYYVEFLGWIECSGLRGDKYTTHVIEDLRKKQKKWKNAPRLTLQVSKTELKISQDVEERKKKEKKIRTVKFPVIPSRDITYVMQARHPLTGQPDDIVACIYLGYVPRTRRYVHVHVYRFDCAETATKYVRFLRHTIADYSERLNRIEMELISKGEIEDPRVTNMNFMMNSGMRQSPRDPGLGSSDGMSEPHTDSYPDSGASTYSGSLPSDEIEPDMISLKDQMPFDSVTEELKMKLGMTTKKEGAPLLLPPKDYDTIRRKQGNLEKVDLRRSLNVNIVGESAWTPRPRNKSEESGVELPSPSEGSESEPKFPDLGYEGNDVSTIPELPEQDPMMYPPQTARSPRISRVMHEKDLMRVPSFSSAYSSHSYRSATSSTSNGYPEVENAVIYTGRKQDAEIPPADYEDSDPFIHGKENHWDSRDFNKSMPANMFPRGVPEYAVINKKRATSTNTPPSKYNMDLYSPRGNDARIRRVNSMYK
ncbi:hypothetical protein FSP39_003559 [Pinctada imbricata]|uniref:Uncharacterized protein n=1 Tax=Pinctada imbricata TaxID=66713 RepID=A0AA89BLG5_PINIB|nr:hypothetical protein FSP39_003559 [Pinctada imbricata]